MMFCVSVNVDTIYPFDSWLTEISDFFSIYRLYFVDILFISVVIVHLSKMKPKNRCKGGFEPSQNNKVLTFHPLGKGSL